MTFAMTVRMSDAQHRLTGSERREAAERLERAAVAVSGSRWFAFVLPLLLAFMLLQVIFIFGIPLIALLVPLGILGNGRFETATDLIRLRQEKTIRRWLIASTILTLLFVAGAMVLLWMALHNPDPGGHLALTIIAFVFAGYGCYLVFSLKAAASAAKMLNVDEFATSSSPPGQPEIFLSTSNLTMPPRPTKTTNRTIDH